MAKQCQLISKLWRLWPGHIKLLKLMQCALARITLNNYDDIHYMNLTTLCSLVSLQSDCCSPDTICLLLNAVLRSWQFGVWLTKARRWVRTILQGSRFLPDWLTLLIIERPVTTSTVMLMNRANEPYESCWLPSWSSLTLFPKLLSRFVRLGHCGAMVRKYLPAKEGY